MLGEKHLEELILSEGIIEIPSAPLCPICSTPLEEDWTEEIDDDSEAYEVEAYRCYDCGHSEVI